MDAKVCSKCRNEKPVGEFYKNRSQADGYQVQCKACFNASNKASYEKHRESRLVKMRETNHRPGKAEKRKEASRVWYAAKGREWHNQYNAGHRDQERERVRRWQRNNREYVRQAVNRYRLRLRSVGGSHTVEEWTNLCKQYGHRCLACGEQKPLTRDHVVPVFKGGTDNISNIQPLCKACNTAKGVKETDYRQAP